MDATTPTLMFPSTSLYVSRDTSSSKIALSIMLSTYSDTERIHHLSTFIPYILKILKI